MDYLKSIKKAVKRSVSDSILIDSLGGFFTYVDDSVYDSVLDTVLDSVECSVNETMWGGLKNSVSNQAEGLNTNL